MWHCIIWVSRSTKVNWGHWPRLISQWPIVNRLTFSGFSEVLNLNLWFLAPKNIPKPLLTRPLGQSSSFVQFVFWPLRRSQPAGVMSFYLGALRILNIATGYSNNTLSCLALNWKHAAEGFRSLRHTYVRRYERVRLKISLFAKSWLLT